MRTLVLALSLCLLGSVAEAKKPNVNKAPKADRRARKASTPKARKAPKVPKRKRSRGN